jgi:hypothetical protein
MTAAPPTPTRCPACGWQSNSRYDGARHLFWHMRAAHPVRRS